MKHLPYYTNTQWYINQHDFGSFIVTLSNFWGVCTLYLEKEILEKIIEKKIRSANFKLNR